ncbi:seed maturation-like protein [Trifolium pratense]|uniref:Seed maturation-like protein n=1 Tax=Trifolium pratense TaxID=57577 RepID=A0A2K3PRW6_TRIPR|nr:seed maturation-like protein [Trifolium pratense]
MELWDWSENGSIRSISRWGILSVVVAKRGRARHSGAMSNDGSSGAEMVTYTLWNAEYRMSLTRNLEMSCGDRGSDCETSLETLEVNGGREDREEREDGEEIEKVVSDLGFKDLEICSSSTSSGAGVFGDLPPQALKYIQQLQSELTNMTEELNAQKQEMMQLEHDRGIRNNLLEYLRSFDPNVVAEMSRPSSVEVEDIIHQLVQNILRRFLLDDASSNFIEQSVEDYHPDSDDEFSDTVATSRDYLAKLLFWSVNLIVIPLQEFLLGSARFLPQ